MTFDSEHTEASRKALDDIRRELDAEYGYIEIPDAPAAAQPTPRQRERSEPRATEVRSPRARADADDAASIARLQSIADRHGVSLGGRRDSGERSRRSGYLIAAVAGCVAGQVLLVAFLAATRYTETRDLFRTIAAIAPRRDEPAAALPPSATDDSRPSESVAQADPPPEATSTSSSAAAPATAPQPSDPPPAVAAAPDPPSSAPPAAPPPAIVSAATVGDATLPPRPAEESRASSPRKPAITPVSRAESQARLRSTLNHWLRTSARGGAPLETTEPVIVLAPDGRTAKTYVSIASPIGFIPREQRWEFGPGGWTLVDDRQAGLPTARPATTERQR